MWNKLWSNFVFRNAVAAASLLLIFLVVVSLLLNIFTRHNRYKDVPDFVGVTMEEAQRYAKKDRLRLEINDSLYIPSFPPGVILEQKPEAGTKVKSGRRIFVTTNSFRQKMADVPYVTGYSLRQARNILQKSGFEIERLIYVDDIATNNILRQQIRGQEVVPQRPVQAELGSGVVLTVGRSDRNEATPVPRVVGLTLRDAKGRIWESGLNFGRSVADDNIDARNIHNARVYRQSPEQGRYIGLGSEVSVWISLDSLTIANGAKSSDDAGYSANRERAIRDSLARAGYSGERLDAETEWIRKVERGAARPEERPESLDRMEGGPDDYDIEVLPLESLQEDTGKSSGGEDEFFF